MDVKLLKLRASNQTEAMTEILDAKAVVVGSPTLNNQMFPTLSSFLTLRIGFEAKRQTVGFLRFVWLGRRRCEKHG